MKIEKEEFVKWYSKEFADTTRDCISIESEGEDDYLIF